MSEYPFHVDDEVMVVTALIGGVRKMGDEWFLPEGKTLPTQDEINKKRTEMRADYDAKQYQRDRQPEYPQIGDQLDMLYHAIDAGKVNKTSDFYKALKAVKDKHPKG